MKLGNYMRSSVLHGKDWWARTELEAADTPAYEQAVEAIFTMAQSYKGPGGVILTRDEAEELLKLLTLNPRAWNAELRGRLIAYLDLDCEA